MTKNKNRKHLVPGIEQALEKFKFEIAGELGIMDSNKESSLEAALGKYKNEIAEELGISAKINKEGWENISSRQCGAVGGRMGGSIGGNMVKKMITMAEDQLKK